MDSLHIQSLNSYVDNTTQSKSIQSSLLNEIIKYILVPGEIIHIGNEVFTGVIGLDSSGISSQVATDSITSGFNSQLTLNN